MNLDVLERPYARHRVIAMDWPSGSPNGAALPAATDAALKPRMTRFLTADCRVRFQVADDQGADQRFAR
jgi:hypothetical protein